MSQLNTTNTQPPGTGLAAARTVKAGLRRLRERAPHSIADRVAERLGLGEGYVEVPGPIGPLFVAFGPGGILLVERAEDAGSFEEQFRLTFRRPIRRAERAPAHIERA